VESMLQRGLGLDPHGGRMMLGIGAIVLVLAGLCLWLAGMLRAASAEVPWPPRGDADNLPADAQGEGFDRTGHPPAHKIPTAGAHIRSG
jgi:hypothetical protein